MPLASSPEQPVPVRTISRLLGEWIERLGRVWVEGQLTGLRPRPGLATVYAALRDPVADVSVPLAVPRALCAGLAEGTRVVAWVKPTFGYNRGQLSLTAYDVRPVGVGALLARLERLRTTLAAEGLFAAERKRRLPFLPRTVGLVCGRASAAERDVRENAARRWPAVRFRVEEAAVQGPYAVTELLAALQRLDADPEVDVIVLARGGGSFEDLLPFSDEALCRAVAGCRTPVVTAIGHEQDVPLVDLVADRRASTPTDAGKLVVPDVEHELTVVREGRARARRTVQARLGREAELLAGLRARPVLDRPDRLLVRYADELIGLRDRAERCVQALLDRCAADTTQLRARVAALSPAATLARGYAVVRRAVPAGAASGATPSAAAVVRSPAEVSAGDLLRVRVAGGEFAARVDGAP